MKKFLSLLFCAVILLTADALELDGSWYLNTWWGYKPLPVMEKIDGNGLHIRKVTAKYGCGIRSRSLIPAQAGDTVKFTALVKGKGRMFFQLQDYDAEKKWIAVAPGSAKTDLTADWREITLSVKVENHKSRITAFSAPTAGVDQGGELFMKDSKVAVERSDYAGDFVFPRHWKVFAPVDPALQVPLDQIPERIAGSVGRDAVLHNGMLEMTPFFPEPKLRNTAWLYGVVEASAAGKYTIGAGADYFLAVYVNGKCVLDTLQTGNQAAIVHFSNHKAEVQLEKGKNIIAVKFQAGASKRPAISLGGSNELRNLASILTVGKTFARDDYEQPGKRIGDPALIKGILTDGIERMTGQGVYRKNSMIAFDQKYQLPSKLSSKLFAMGLRLYRVQGAGNLIFQIGSEMSLSVARGSEKSDFTMTVFKHGKPLKSTILPAAALPCDIVFAVDVNEYYVNAMSLQDSKLRSLHGKAAFEEKAPFTAAARVYFSQVVVDEFFTGIAQREVKSNTIPFKIDLDQTFDPVKAGWPLVWSDEFEGKEVDWKNNWMNSPWHPVPANRDLARLENGKLHIKAEFTPDPAKPGKFKGRSVGLYSQKRFLYGYYEAKVRFTRKKGWWAAFWLYEEGRNAAVGGGYEIDIFEDYSTRSGKNIIANNLHFTFGCGGRSYGYHCDLPGPLEDFYVIGCKWTPFEISLYINGKLVRSSSRHSPYQSATYDAVNHGFGTGPLYLCLSGQCGTSGGAPQAAGSEEFVVEYVRAYALSKTLNPQIRYTRIPSKSCFRKGEKIVFDVEALPSKQSGAKIRNLYLFDNGNLIDYKSGGKGRFEFAVDEKHYNDTIWASASRGKRKSVFDAYPRFFIAAAQDEKGRVAFTSPFPVIVDMGKSTPHKGIMPHVPGKIDTAKYDDGGNGNATYKQKNGGGTFPVGQENLFSRKKLNLREVGEWANFTFCADRSGTYDIILERDLYRRFWPMRGIVLIDGVYAGTFHAKEHQNTAVLENVKLSAGIHRMTLFSACAYGIWPLSLEFKLK